MTAFPAQAPLAGEPRRIADEVIAMARRGESIPGQWLAPLSPRPLAADLWDRVAESLTQQAP